MNNCIRISTSGVAAMALVFGQDADADEAMLAYDVRCAPSIQYFSVAPIEVTTPENLLFSEPNGEPDRGSFEALRQSGLLFAEREQEYRCTIGTQGVRVFISPNYNLVVKVNDVVVFDAPSTWSTDDTGKIGKQFELSRTYELTRLELDREIWKISTIAIPKDVYSRASPFPHHLWVLVHTRELTDKPPVKAIDQRYAER